MMTHSLCRSSYSREKGKEINTDHKLSSYETVNEIICTIEEKKVITANDTAVLRKKLKNQLRKRVTKKSLKKLALEEAIKRALVVIAAEKESIIINDARIQNEIDKQSLYFGLSKSRFQKRIEKQTGLPFSEWIKDLRYNLMKNQLVQVSMSVPQPTTQEIKRFYRKNKRKIGIEVRYKEMVFRVKNKNIQDELRVSKIVSEVYQKIRNKPQLFASVAKTTHSNTSSYKRNGGLRPFYEGIYDIAAKNSVLASLLFRHPKGVISRPFRDSKNRYMIVNILNRRPLSFAKVRDLILRRLYAEKQDRIFQKWFEKKLKEAVIICL